MDQTHRDNVFGRGKRSALQVVYPVTLSDSILEGSTRSTMETAQSRRRTSVLVSYDFSETILNATLIYHFDPGTMRKLGRLPGRFLKPIRPLLRKPKHLRDCPIYRESRLVSNIPYSYAIIK